MGDNGQVPAEQLALALDVDDLVEALRLGRQLKTWFGVAKVGLELFTAAGPDAIGSLLNLGYQVFLDLKLYDIPTTVNRAARVAGAIGASYLTFHAQAGPVVLRAGVEGFMEGADAAGLDPPVALAVTVLTSDDRAPAHVLGDRVRIALETRCSGIVCAASDVREAKQLAPKLIAVVPGLRVEGGVADDQKRHATPRDALANGADLLVIGRPVTRADDPAAAAAALVGSLS